LSQGSGEKERYGKLATSSRSVLHNNALQHRPLLLKKHLAKHNVMASKDRSSPDLNPLSHPDFPVSATKVFRNDDDSRVSARALAEISKNSIQQSLQKLQEHWLPKETLCK
jgi:hypothetical protein